jgi:restriction system protein
VSRDFFELPKAMILDYSEYFTETAYTHDMPVSFTKSGDRKLFFDKRGFCPFCKKSIPLVNRQSRIQKEVWGFDIFEEYFYAWVCISCGWWEVKTYEESGTFFDDGSDDRIRDIDVKHAILKSYDPQDVSLPVNTLREVLGSRTDYIYEIHPRKMEELVQSVFSDFYDCQVEHCGRSHDGGIDLILIDSDKPAMVQVKRRVKPDSVEAVSSVREFLGAVLLSGSRRGIFVTTANHFSSSSVDAASQAVTMNLVQEFELYDLDRFLRALNLVSHKVQHHWQQFLPKWCNTF